ncbi:MAG: hypothetical protein ACXAC5_15150 [Promethearchaeota archaeon]
MTIQKSAKIPPDRVDNIAKQLVAIDGMEVLIPTREFWSFFYPWIECVLAP